MPIFVGIESSETYRRNVQKTAKLNVLIATFINKCVF